MATNYPTSLDTFTNPTAGSALNSPSHAGQHADINDAMEAVQAKLGVGAGTIGEWSDFTPNFSPDSGSWTTVSTTYGRYTKVNKLVVGEAGLQISNYGTANGAINFTLPVTAATGNLFSIGAGREGSVTGWTFAVWKLSTTTAAIRYYQNGNIADNNVSVFFSFAYEAA